MFSWEVFDENGVKISTIYACNEHVARYEASRVCKNPNLKNQKPWC